MFPHNILFYQLYLLQIENYEIARYWRLLTKRGYFRSKIPLRKGLVFTSKAVALLGEAVLIHFFVAVMIATFWADFFTASFFIIGLIAYAALSLIYPVWFSLAFFLLSPADYLVKKLLIQKARAHLKKFPKLTIIGIAGSYGKTTTKEVLAAILSTKYACVKTGESVNTPVGIARLILKKITAETRIFIVEFGEHYPHDIAYLCSLAAPDFAVITGINESHRERLKTVEKSAATIFEIAEHMKSDGTLVINADDEQVMNTYEKYAGGKRVLFYSAKNNPRAAFSIQNKQFSVDRLGFSFAFYKNNQLFFEGFLPLLGEYSLGTLMAACSIGEDFGMTAAELKSALTHIVPVPHRLAPMRGEQDVLIIDDSYNGNPDGVREAIQTLARFTNRRKVYITPGLVEMGEATAQVHQEVGEQLSKVADLVILIKNSVTPFIAEGLEKNGFKRKKIAWFETAQAAHEAMRTLLRPGDVVLFQNDWGDQYI